MNNIIDILLGLEKEENRKSCLMMAIRNARHLTGRDVETGEAKDMNTMRTNVNMRDEVFDNCLEDESFFAGIVMYLIALDSIGCLFGKKGNKKNSIKRALDQFSSLSDGEISALVDLRNTLAHNFGLATEKEHNNGNKKSKHKYTLAFSDDAEAIKLPETEWDGVFTNKDSSSSTVIGVKSFCNLVESIIANVYECHRNGDLEMRVDEDEAKARFTVLS